MEEVTDTLTEVEARIDDHIAEAKRFGATYDLQHDLRETREMVAEMREEVSE